MGVGFGVGICTAIVVSEPYLAPAWPACSGITSAGLITTFGGLNLTKYVVANAAVTVGSVYYCAENEVF